MRILVDGDDVHVWHTTGHFTIHTSDRVTWHTPRVANRDYANSGGDQDLVLVKPRALDDAADALALADGRLAIAYGGDAPRVDILDGERVVTSIPLAGTGPRLPGLETDPGWPRGAAPATFEGYGTRAIRLFASRDGFWVTANESGHVAHYAFSTNAFDVVHRVPGAPENTVYVVELTRGFLAGMKWNHRHSDILQIDGGLVARWPSDNAVRWGMPAPVVLGDRVVTYSDDGPHARQLALLAIGTLAEIDHAPVSSWPVDMHGDGKRFACVSPRDVVIGRVDGDKLVIDETWSIAAAMKAAGVGGPERPKTATVDGRGTRTWLEQRVAAFGVDNEILTLVDQVTGEVRRGDRVLLDGKPPATGIDAFFAPRREVFDIAGERIVYSSGEELVVLPTDQHVETVGYVVKARLVPGGVFYVEQDRDDRDKHTWCWAGENGEDRELGTSRRNSDIRDPIAVSGALVCWIQFDEQRRPSLHRWHAGSDAAPTTIPLTANTILALAVDGETAYVVTRDGGTHVERVTSRGTERISTAPLPYFVDHFLVTRDRVFFTEPLTHDKDGRNPPQLYTLDDGKPVVLVTSHVESIANLQVHGDQQHGDELWWLESTDPSANIGGGTLETLAAICRLPL
jgi:hypothetical protein